MTGTEIFLLVLIVLLAVWNAAQQFIISDVDFRMDSLERAQNRHERHIKLNEESAHDAKGDIRLLVERLGLYFDTIPRQESKRILRKRENDEIVDQKLDFSFEIDKEED